MCPDKVAGLFVILPVSIKITITIKPTTCIDGNTLTKQLGLSMSNLNFFKSCCYYLTTWRLYNSPSVKV